MWKKKTLVGLIIGNIPGARERNNPDINWVPALVVQTRAHISIFIELRDRFESTLAIAQDNLSKISRKYKRHYDQKAGKRQLKVSDKALVLLPTDKNKLLMGWINLCDVIEKLSPFDNQIRVDGKEKKRFHINMLKQYLEREDDQEVQSNDETQGCAV